MDRTQEELRSFGFFGIIQEAFKIIFFSRKLFSKITLALILPLSIIYLAHIEFSQLLFFRVITKDTVLEDDSTGNNDYSRVKNSSWAAFWIFQVSCLIVYIILALLSTSAMVYTIACIYTSKEATFKKVMRVVPKVWKRLMVTFLWSFAFIFVYNVIAITILVIFVAIVGLKPVGFGFFIALFVLYLVGLVYISVVWHLASVISVLEEIRGLGALKKSKELIKGKLIVSGFIFVVFVILFSGIELLAEIYVTVGVAGVAIRVLVGIVCVLLLCNLILLALAVQTVVYFVCKAYHNEVIDRSSLSYHLEVNLGDYVQLRDNNNIQMGQIHP